MLCFVYKWLISQAATSGKHLSKGVHHHIQKCDSCREYFQFCESLKKRGRHDASALTDAYTKKLNNKLSVSLPETRAPQPKPFHKPGLVPVTAITLLIAVVFLAIIFTRPQRETVLPLDDISKLANAAAPENVLMKLESPLENEYFQLKQALDSTTKFLVSRLDIRLGQQAQ